MAATSASPANSRVFLGWDRPVLDAAVERLARGWAEGPLDLSTLAVVVPTGHSGRRLREALAARAAERGAALLPPLVITPEVIPAWHEPARRPASRTECLLAWAQALMEADLESLRALFPVLPVNQDWPWALQAAGEFRRLQKVLGESGLNLSSTAKRMGADFLEAGRWQALAELEADFRARLASAGCIDPEEARSAAAHKLRLPDGITKVILLAAPDPLPLAVRGLEALAARGECVEVWINAPDSLSEGFDGWGRPVTEFWQDRPIPFRVPARDIRLLPRPADEATEAVRVITESDRVAIGAVDPETAPHLQTRLAAGGVKVFDPDGAPFRGHVIHWLLTVWSQALQGRSWRAFQALLRIPDFLHALAREANAGEQQLLKDADDLNEHHLPLTMDAALALSGTRVRLAAALNVAIEMAGRFQRAPFAVALPEFLQFAFRHRRVLAGTTDGNAFVQASAGVMAALEEIERGMAEFGGALTASQRLDFLLLSLREARLFPEASDGAVDLLGWLELPWESAPRLVIAGMNEGLVPESITSDAWLPHGLRQQLGLKTNEERFARDAYLLTAMLESRAAAGGWVRALAARETNDGDPLKPSRLLLHCPQDELPARVAQLFPLGSLEEQSPAPVLAWTRAWRLRPPAPSAIPPAKFYVTNFATYLACPFRFYLSRILEMERGDPAKEEMDPRDFGNLCHFALQHMAEHEEMRACADVAQLAAWLKDDAEKEAHARFGPHLSVPLLVQLESAKSRLAAAAAVHVKSRLDGWMIEQVEVEFAKLIGHAWMMEDIEIRGRIDLIERNTRTGHYRVLDYKTGSNQKKPAEAHLKNMPRVLERPLPEWRIFYGEGKPRCWSNLQLPLYVVAARQSLGPNVTAAYFNLPRASTQTAIEDWPGIDGDALLASAEACARGVLAVVNRREFWPPAEKVDNDEFKDIFFNGTFESIDPSLLEPCADEPKA